MIQNITKIFLAPHNDDEALFGAFTIMRERPLVAVVTDSYIQKERGENVSYSQRREETIEAMDILDVPVRFLGIKDTEITEEIFRKQLKLFLKQFKKLREVYIPMIEGGNKIHDLIGKVTKELFGNVTYYSTYGRFRYYSEGDIAIKPTRKERQLKNQILECYHSQKNHRSNAQYFYYAKFNDEFLSSSSLHNLPFTLKEHTLKNLIDCKKIFDKLKIPFCLMDGTLLGVYRDNDFIRGDYDDTDVGFHKKYARRAEKIFAEFASLRFKTKGRWHFRNRFEGGSVIKNGNHIDFFCIHKKGKDAYNLGRNFLPNSDKDYMSYVYPRYCFKKFDKIIFKGMKFNIPHKVEDFLSARYSNWQTPLRRGEGFNWLDQKQNPALRSDYDI